MGNVQTVPTITERNYIYALIFNHYDLWALTLGRPIIIIGITIGFMYFYKSLGSKFKINKYTNPPIGTRG